MGKSLGLKGNVRFAGDVNGLQRLRTTGCEHWPRMDTDAKGDLAESLILSASGRASFERLANEGDYERRKKKRTRHRLAEAQKNEPTGHGLLMSGCALGMENEEA